MSIYVMVPVLNAEGLSPGEKLVALALADNARDDGQWAWPSVQTMSRKTALSERTVQRTLKALIDKGVIEVQEPASRYRPTVYRFLLDESGTALAFMGVTVTPLRGDIDDVMGVIDDVHGRHSDALTVNETSREPSRSSDDDIYPERFEELWKLYPRADGKKAAWRRVRVLLRRNVTYDQMTNAVTNYAITVAGREREYIKLASTFFGRDDHWREWLSPSQSPRAPTSSEDWEAELTRRTEESVPPPRGFADGVRGMMMGGSDGLD